MARLLWLASYPRSGNTWVRMMLQSLQSGGQPVDINAAASHAQIANKPEMERFTQLTASQMTDSELADLTPALHRNLAETSSDPILMRKVHDRCWTTSTGERAFPPECSLGCIYCVRDPRDVAVSCARFMDISMDQAVAMLCDEQQVWASSSKRALLQLPQPMGSWTQHVRSWVQGSGMPVLPIRYEDTLRAPVETVRQIAEFVGLPAEHADRVANVTAFNELRTQEDREGFGEKPRKATKFFHSGKQGEGQRLLTVAQLDRIAAVHGEMMEEFGYR